MKIHPIARHFYTRMSVNAFEDLKKSIDEHGQKDPVILYEEKILDGWHRFKACEEIGIDCEFEESLEILSEKDAVEYLMKVNAARRHMGDTERVILAHKLSQGYTHGGDRKTGKKREIGEISVKKAAEVTGASYDKIKLIRRAEKEGREDLIDSVRNDKITFAQMRQELEREKLEKERLEAIAFDERRKNFQQESGINLKYQERDEKRLAKMEKQKEEYAKNNTALSADKQYQIVYIDPPWKFGDVYSDQLIPKVKNVAYPQMTIEEIKNLSVPDLAYKHSYIFMWTVPSLVVEAREILIHWGFRILGDIVWDKMKIGVSFSMVRYQHENLLIASKGLPARPKHIDAFKSVYQIKARKEHSRKPDFFRDEISRRWPEWSKVELFARKEEGNPSYNGWDVWGNQS